MKRNNLFSGSSLFIVAFLLVATASTAQDTTKKRSIDITSSFKPVLKDAAKINFNATPPSSDTTRPRLQYNIPNQNLVLGYVPGSLKPLALQVDTGGNWGNESYVKAGFGSLKTPYLEAGISVGDGKTSGLNIYAKHISSRGKIEFQDYTNTDVALNAFYQSSKNGEWNVRLASKQERYNRYGFQPKTISFPTDSMGIKYGTWSGRVGFHNINRTAFGLTYAPEIKIDIFNDGIKNSESNTYINLPVQKFIGKNFGVEVAAEANLTRYKQGAKAAINNNFFVLSPAILFINKNINLKAGIKPSWDNGSMKVLPTVMGEFSAADKQVTLQAGWIGYLRKNSFQYVASLNPWIWAPGYSNNSRIIERYVGLKGSLGNHFSYSTKVGFNTLFNQPLFINDTITGKSFLVVNESKMKAIHYDGQVGYTVGEKFSLVSTVIFNKYAGLHDNEKPWGLMPMEFKTAARLQVLKDLYVKADVTAFNSGPFASKTGRGAGNTGLDLSAGAEFAVVKNIKVWAQFNNIANNKYEQWHQYPVYPFNFLGGIVFSFAQNNK
ncbi:MAG: hypothetical protein ABIN57_11670 [Chitinophagaceae bacterium]